MVEEFSNLAEAILALRDTTGDSTSRLDLAISRVQARQRAVVEAVLATPISTAEIIAVGKAMLPYLPGMTTSDIGSIAHDVAAAFRNSRLDTLINSGALK